MKKPGTPDPPDNPDNPDGLRAPSAVPNRAPSVVSDDNRSSTSGSSSSIMTINSQQSDDKNDKDYVPPNTEEEEDEDDEEEGEDEEAPAASAVALASSMINYVFRGGKGKGRGKGSTSQKSSPPASKSSTATKESGQSTSTAGTENNEEEHDHMVINGVEYACDPVIIKLFKEQLRQKEIKKTKRLTKKKQTRQATRQQVPPQNSTVRLCPCRCYCRRSKNKDSPLAGLVGDGEPNWVTNVQLIREKNVLDSYIREAPLPKDKDTFSHTMSNLGYLCNTKLCSITPDDFNGGCYLRV